MANDEWISEKAALARIAVHLADVRHKLDRMIGGRDKLDVVDVLKEAEAFVKQLQFQVGRGVHRNPPLAIYGNPPALGISRRAATGGFRGGRFNFVDVISAALHDIRYTHAADHQDYRHSFKRGTAMWAIDREQVPEPANRSILIVNEDGAWDEFD